MIVGAEPTLTLEDIHWMMNVNFWGAVHTSRAALPHMRRAKFGRIANVSSIGGRLAVPHMLPYTASKFALTGYTKSLRPEALRDNIYVTGIYPPTIRTGGHRHAWFKGNQQAEYSWFLARRRPPRAVDLRRVGGPDGHTGHPVGRPGKPSSAWRPRSGSRSTGSSRAGRPS